MDNRAFFKEYEELNGFDISDPDKQLMEKQEFECFTCGNSFKESFNDFKVVDDKVKGSSEEFVVCYDCYCDDYLTECSICSDSFENPESPEETVLYVNEYASKEVDLSIGFYQVLKFPYYLSDGFSMSLFDDTVKKISDLDMRKLGFDDSYMSSGKVCYDCQEKYKGNTIVKHTHTRGDIHKTIYDRGLIISLLIINK